MNKFKIDPSKQIGTTHRTPVFVEPDLYRWVKVVAAANEVSVPSVLNQAVEFAKKNSERISI